jgi:flagellar basal body P-ring protein FlgI
MSVSNEKLLIKNIISHGNFLKEILDTLLKEKIIKIDEQITILNSHNKEDRIHDTINRALKEDIVLAIDYYWIILPTSERRLTITFKSHIKNWEINEQV